MIQTVEGGFKLVPLRGMLPWLLHTSMIKGSDETRFPRARVVRRLQGSQFEELGFRKSLRGSRRDMKFKGPSEDRARLLGHEHLEAFLDGDSVSRVFVIRGEPSRMRRAGLLSHRVKLLQRIDPVSLLVEIILEKHNHTKARSSNSAHGSNFNTGLSSFFLPKLVTRKSTEPRDWWWQWL